MSDINGIIKHFTKTQFNAKGIFFAQAVFFIVNNALKTKGFLYKINKQWIHFLRIHRENQELLGIKILSSNQLFSAFMLTTPSYRATVYLMLFIPYP